jgi:hypothetical protein
MSDAESKNIDTVNLLNIVLSFSNVFLYKKKIVN